MPIQTFMPDGYTPIFNSDAAGDGVCLGTYTVAAGQSFYKQFALLAGTQVRRMNSWSFDVEHKDEVGGITYPGSVPTVALSPVSFGRQFTLWATGQPTIQNSAGVQALSPSGGIALSPTARGLNYIGRATFNRYEGVADNSTTLAPQNIDYYRIDSATIPTFVLRLYADSRVSVAYEARLIGGTTWEIGVTRARNDSVAGHNNAFNLPLDIYCFATPNTPSTNPEFSVRDTEDGSLAYDLMQPLLTAQQMVDFPPGTTAVSVSTPGSVYGVIGTPRLSDDVYAYQGDEQDGSAGTTFRDWVCGAWMLTGGSLRVEYVWRHHTELYGFYPWQLPPSSYTYENFTTPLINLTGF